MTGKIISNRQQKNHSFRSFISGRNAETIQLPAVKKHGLDYPLLIAVILICAFGIVMLFSASYYYAELTQGDGLHYVRTQSIFLFFGLIGMLLLSHVPYTFYSNKWVALSLYAALIVSLLAVKLVGVELQGSKRWLSLGFTTVQPSEFSKIILTICMGGYAAKHVKETGDPALAAIASDDTSTLFGLKVLDKSINDVKNNTTRFAAFSRAQNRPSSPKKREDENFILVFTVRNEAGSLAQTLNIIGAHGFNMRSLRSRPMKELQWNYFFYIEAEGNIYNENGQDMLRELGAVCAKLRLVGTYYSNLKTEE